MYIHMHIHKDYTMYMYIQIHQYRNLSDGISNEDMDIQVYTMSCIYMDMV